MSDLSERDAQNIRVAALYRGVGNKWYPHVFEEGVVRWVLC